MIRINHSISVLAICVLSACNSSSDSSPDDPEFLFVSDTDEIAQISLEDLRSDDGDLLPVLFDTQTELDLAYAGAGVELVNRMNEALILPADIDVVFADCGIANAFYVTSLFPIENSVNVDAFDVSDGGAVIICHELTELFANFYTEPEQAVGASLFVLMHELGHALVNQLRLPVLGIEESYVDGMAAVFLGEAGLSEGSVLAGWFFGSQAETPFFDSHRAGPQRLGDLACWGVGADPALSDDPLIGSIAQQLILGGRNCEFEYNQQRTALMSVLAPSLRGDLSTFLGDVDLLPK